MATKRKDIRLALGAAAVLIAAGGVFLAARLSKSDDSGPLPNNQANLARNLERAKAGLAAAKQDRAGLVQTAVDGMRRHAADRFGLGQAAEARITAEESGLRDLSDERWEVSGRYAGKDQDGREFTAPFTVALQVLFYGVHAVRVDLDEPTYHQ